MTMNRHIEKNPRARLEVAVIGMAGRFPGSKNIHEFWENLKNGVESITFFSDEEVKKEGVSLELIKDPNYVKAFGMLEDVNYFDASFFGYTPGEAEIMNPEMRLFHECTWEALEDAGYNPESYDGLIGIYAGASSNFIWEGIALLSGKNRDIRSFEAGHLTNTDFLTTRISYKFNLKGPSSFIQTACSTSLVTIHWACRSVLSGECHIALAGGVKVGVNQRQGYMYEEGMIRSPDGHCRAFDEEAKGIVSGNGIGIVVLKRLKNAVADRDHIYAVIKGSAINNDGNRKVGYTAPSVQGQVEVIRTAHSMAHVEPESIGYVETHGTGTSLGDPVEIEALTRAFNTDKRNYCPIGAIKTNFGHLDTAAGAAGFIKTVLILKNKLIPPSLHFKEPNPKIDFKNSPFYVNTKLRICENNEYPLRAGVSSFGIGGTNAHAVLEEWPDDPSSNARRTAHSAKRKHQLILLSAKTQSALDKMTENLAEYFKKNLLNRGNRENPTNLGLTLADAAYSLQVGRKAFKYRRMAVCPGVEEAIKVLSSPLSADVHTSCIKGEDNPVVFMFSGQGSQYVNMGRELYREVPVFRNETDRCFEILNTLLEHNIKNILYPEEAGAASIPLAEAETLIDDVFYSGPIKFTFEYALAKVLMEWGIKPYAMIGHSFGEYMVAHLSGVFSLEDALKLAVLRGKLMAQAPKGGMMSVSLPEHQLEPLLEDEIDLAAVNSPSLCIVSGPTPALEKFQEQLSREGVECLRINFPRASHSKMMRPIFEEFESAVSKVKLNDPRIPYISGLTGNWLTGHEAKNPTYYARHLVETVRFADGIQLLLQKKNAIFIQVSSDRGLPLFVEQNQAGEDAHTIINLVRHKNEKIPDTQYLLNSIGRLWLAGQKIDWSKFYPEEKPYRIPLPPYPFERNSYWIEGSLLGMGREWVEKVGFSSGKKADTAEWFYIPSWKSSLLPVFRSECLSYGNTWMIFYDECPLGVQLIKKLKQHKQELIIIKMGGTFSRINSNEYIINPANRDEYSCLFDDWNASGNKSLKILYLWGISNNKQELSFERLDTATLSGFKSLIYLAQAIGKLKDGNEYTFQLFVLTAWMQKTPGSSMYHPEKSLVLGPVKVIPLEYPNIATRVIDIGFIEPGNRGEERIVDQLLAEFMTESKDWVIAYRDNDRLVQNFEPVRLDKSEELPPLLKEKGTYWITGGLGGIGLELAEYLAERVRAKLVLTGRSEFPPKEQWNEWLATHDKKEVISQKISRLKKFEKWGAEILVLCGDVSDMKSMKQMVDQAQIQLGKINGIIHAAGVPEGSIIQRKTEEMIKHVLDAKVRGTLVLHTVLENVALDFFVLCSSGNSIVPNFGQVGYCSANAFLDAFAHYRTRVHGKFTLSINWNRWRNTGMSIALEAKHKEITGEELAGGITPAQGIDAFARILGNIHSQVAVSNIDLQWLIRDFNAKIGVKEQEKEELPLPVMISYPRPNLSASYDAPTNEVEQSLAEIWQKFFGIEAVGINDDFFELGGDSLKAMTLIAKIHKKLNVRIPVTDFFSSDTTIKNLAEYISGNTKKSYFSSIIPAEKKEFYRLSSAQQRLYILYQIDPESLAYNVYKTVLLEGSIQKEVLTDAFRKFINRHESLRTSFEMIEGKPGQRIHELSKLKFEIEFYDSGIKEGPGKAIEGGRQEIDEIIRGFIKAFNLFQAPIIRVGLVRLEKLKHVLMVDMHHIITDGISQHILINDFLSLYNGRELPSLKLQYKDYSEWQQSEMRKGVFKLQEKYWLREFAGDIPVLNLPTDFSRPGVQSFAGNTLYFEIIEKETLALNEIARAIGSTLFMILLAIFYVFLYKLTNQEDIVVGTPIAGRQHADLEKLIGMFVNTLALRNHAAGDKTFIGFVNEVKEKTLSAFENQDYQFEELVENTVVERDMSKNPLFDAMFVLQNIDAPRETLLESEMEGIKIKPYGYERHTVNFDLTLTAVESKEKLYFSFEYCTKLFRHETIQRWITYFKNITALITQNTGANISELEIITGEEKNCLLYELNDTKADFPKDKTIHQLFEEQVEQTPDFIAVIGASLEYAYYVQLSYRELDKRTDQLACRLHHGDVQPDTIVGIMVDRSIEMIIGIMGILKSGAAYLPIDHSYPEERIKYMLADSETKVLVTTGTLIEENEKVRRWEGEKILLEDLSVSSVAKPPPQALNWSEGHHIHHSSLITHHSKNLAYIIYTSGSTGKPKGMLIEHRNVVRLMFNDKFHFDFNTRDIWTMFHSYCFDFSVWEMYGALLYGGKLLVIPKITTRDLERYLDILKKSCVTVLNQTPSAFSNLSNLELNSPGNELSIRYVIFGGEALIPSCLKGWISKYPGTKLINMYGITETTVHVTFKELKDSDIELDISNIGKPIPTLSTYVIDKNLKLLPIGVAGELCVGGEGVGRGYLNRTELSREKFIENPYKVGERLYKSGDLVKLLSIGELQYIGRIDYQVKIRGFRIELGEIESQLLKCHDICESIVIDRENIEGKKYICAYFVSEKKIDISELRGILSKTLPGYMIPSYFIQVERIPLTANGKIDRKALNSIGIEMKSKEEYAAPRNEIEKKIVEIWKEVLSLEKVGVSENFFDIGGTSLDIVRLNAKFKEVFNEEETVVQMFRYPTIRSFGEYLIRKKDGIVSNNNIHRYVPINKIKQTRQNQKTKRIKGGISNG